MTARMATTLGLADLTPVASFTIEGLDSGTLADKLLVIPGDRLNR